MIIGAIGTLFQLLSKKLLIKLEIDDGLGLISVHGVCGFWGLVAAGLFDESKGTLNTGSITQVSN